MLESDGEREAKLARIANLYDELPFTYRLRLMVAFFAIGFNHRLHHCLKSLNFFQ